MVDRIISHVQFTGQTRGGLTLADPAQQQNHLRRSQVLIRKHGARIDCVHRLTVTAALLRDMATACSPEATCVLDARSTLWTAQTLWMKVLSQPDLAKLVVAYVENWKIHVISVSP